MSFIHYLFLGHFEHDGECVRFSKSPNDSAYKPVVRHPIDTKVIKAILRESKGADIDELTFPDEVSHTEEGYLVCDKYTTNQETINFVTRLVERTTAMFTTSPLTARSLSTIGWERCTTTQSRDFSSAQGRATGR